MYIGFYATDQVFDVFLEGVRGNGFEARYNQLHVLEKRVENPIVEGIAISILNMRGVNPVLGGILDEGYNSVVLDKELDQVLAHFAVCSQHQYFFSLSLHIKRTINKIALLYPFGPIFLNTQKLVLNRQIISLEEGPKQYCNKSTNLGFWQAVSRQQINFAIQTLPNPHLQQQQEGVGKMSHRGNRKQRRYPRKIRYTEKEQSPYDLPAEQPAYTQPQETPLNLISKMGLRQLTLEEKTLIPLRLGLTFEDVSPIRTPSSCNSSEGDSKTGVLNEEEKEDEEKVYQRIWNLLVIG